jgi:hypothetical protein
MEARVLKRVLRRVVTRGAAVVVVVVDAALPSPILLRIILQEKMLLTGRKGFIVLVT